jgi:hypothetical protein
MEDEILNPMNNFKEIRGKEGIVAAAVPRLNAAIW